MTPNPQRVPNQICQRFRISRNKMSHDGFEWLVARRYLRSPHRPAVLRLVTLLSVLGVAAGVATLVIALAMNTGFDQTLQDRLLGVTAHITLSIPGADGITTIKNWRSDSRKLPACVLQLPRFMKLFCFPQRGSARLAREGTRSGRINPTKRCNTS